MDAKDNEEGDKSGGNVPDPFRDPQADSVSFFDDRDEGLYFGTGDQESVAENQPDDDNLRLIVSQKPPREKADEKKRKG